MAAIQAIGATTSSSRVYSAQTGSLVHYVGTEARGVELEVLAVPDDRNPGGLAVIHAMPTSFRNKEGDRP